MPETTGHDFTAWCATCERNIEDDMDASAPIDRDVAESWADNHRCERQVWLSDGVTMWPAQRYGKPVVTVATAGELL